MRARRCECCGLLTLTGPQPGSYEVCSVCFWEDDPVQNADPLYEGGANGISLRRARRNWIAIGACEPRFVSSVRPILPPDIPPVPTIGGLDGDLGLVRQWAAAGYTLAVVRGMLAGSIGIAEGSLHLASAILDRKIDWAARLTLFQGIASKTDDMPFGAVRELWNAEALAAKDRELAAFEKQCAGAGVVRLPGSRTPVDYRINDLDPGQSVVASGPLHVR